MPWVKLGPLLEKVTGRRLLKLPMHGGLMRLSGRIVDRLGVFFPLDIPVNEEAMEYATNWVKLDNSKVEDVLAFKLRPLTVTMADTVAWLYQAGHISQKQAGTRAIAKVN